MKRSLSLLLALLLLLSLAACGREETAAPADPNLGLYEASSASAFGVSMDLSELFEDALSVELMDGGKASVHLNGKDYRVTWSLEGQLFTAKGLGVELKGTLSDGVLLIQNAMGAGLDITLIRKGAAGDSAQPAAVPAETAPETGAPAETGGTPAEEGEAPAGASGDLSALVGSWRHESGYTYVLRADGTGAYQHNGEEMRFTYSVEGSTLRILFDGSSSPMELPFTVTADRLTVLDHFGSEVVYERVGGEAAGGETASGAPDADGPVLQAFASFPVYDAGQAMEMSSWMNYGENYIEDEVFYGAFFLYKVHGKQFVSFELVHDGNNLSWGKWSILDPVNYPMFLQRRGDTFFYTMGNTDKGSVGVSRVNRDGSDLRVLYEGECSYTSLAGDRIYFTNGENRLVSMDLDGGDLRQVMDKEVYYCYCLNDEWIIFQDDADKESLHLLYLPSMLDIKLNDERSYSPMLFGSLLFYQTYAEGDPEYAHRLACIDLSKWEAVEDPALGCKVPRFTAEYSEGLIGPYYFLDGTLVYPANNWNAKAVADWRYLEDDAYQGAVRYYQYMDENYQIELQFSGNGLVHAILFHDRRTNYGNSLPWLY